MRIISGQHKGRRITAPKNLPVRPTTDMAKEALFNILNNQIYFEGCKVLDLFAGTGNISYEFASRGTKGITAVDADAGCIAFMAKTAKALEMDMVLVKSDVFNFLEKTQIKVDVIFADPPYDLGLNNFARIPELVFNRQILESDGLLIIEHSNKTDLSGLPFFKNARKYGGSMFSFFSEPD